MKKYLLVWLTMCLLFLAGCTEKPQVKQVKADYFDIGLGQELFEARENVHQKTIQSLVDAYNQIEYTGQTDEPLDNDQSIFINFIHNDQFSGHIQIDKTGKFTLGVADETYEIDRESDFYDKALVVYQEVKKQY
ncbi:hypothetical protein [Sporosarcina sp.]|uniref:hypothetical protein n=1 Tax=Sporosarcina sp. TaxID=49982 RepID=UPI0026138B58|nr:hypothetical protein [Sporosarcina sp.]